MMLWINLGILVGLFVVGFGIGRYKKQDAYEEQMKNLIAEKNYWHGIATHKVNAPPSVNWNPKP